MYLLRHLPPELKRRWDDQLALQHDVDIKRLWRRTPQAMDSVIGGPPINATIDWPYDASSSTSGSDDSESDTSSSTQSSSSSSKTECPQCVTITIVGITGECSILNRTYHCQLSGECSDGDLVYSKSGTIEIDDEDYSLLASAWYDRTAERWSATVAVGPSSATFSSDFGLSLDWEGTLEHEAGCDGDATLTHSEDPCPDESSSSSSSSSSTSSSSSSSSSASSSSDSESASVESSSEATGSSSEEESSSSLDCPHTICALWFWAGGIWHFSSYYGCSDGPCENAHCQSDNPPPPSPPPPPNNTFVRFCDNSFTYTQL